MRNIRALRIVREQRGLDIAKVAKFASISAERLADFEQGEREPSRKQLERLANTYGVPLYSFFGDSLPNLLPLPQDFRKVDPSPAALSPRGVRSLLSSEKISAFAKQLAIELNYKPDRLKSSTLEESDTAKRAAALRNTFNGWYETRSSKLALTGAFEQQFLSAFRLFFEVQGNVANFNDAPAEDYLGFFISPEGACPTIFVNRTVSSKKAQLFTFAHEYCHALLGQEGVSNPFLPRNKIERNCNVFAAEFIAPMKQFSREVEALPQSIRSETSRFIDAASATSLLSKHATAIRLVEGDYITQGQLQSWRRIFVSNSRSEKDEEKELVTSTGGVPHAKSLSEIGHLPVYLASRAVRAKLIDTFDVEDGIGLSRQLQDKAFSLAERRFDAASF